MSKKEIKWVKWQDPFVTFHELNEDNNDFDSEEQDWEFAKIEFMGEKYKRTNFRGEYLVSNALGLLPLGSHNLPGSQNKFWIGHTNFKISESIEDEIAESEGVDAYKTISPYRFWLGIGFLFKDVEVQETISKNVCKEYEKKDFGKIALKKNYPFFAYVTKSNKEKILIHGKTQEEVEEKLKTIEDIKNVKKSW